MSDLAVGAATGNAVARIETTDQAARNLRAWRTDVVGYVKSQYGVTPDDWQGDVLSLYPYEPRLAMQACVGPGKTAVLVWIAQNFLLTRPDPKIGAVSITWPNLRDNFWTENAKWMKRSEFVSQNLTWGATRIVRNDNPQEVWMSARTWERAADSEKQANALAGLHSDYVMVIADETGGMPPAVLNKAESILSSCIEGHIVQAGNPTHLAGALYRAVVESGKYRTIRISGDPLDPNRAPRVSVEWANDMIDDFGRDSGVVRGNVLGKFPKQASDAIVGLHHWEDALDRRATDEVTTGHRVLGVDVARFGTDRTVVCFRDGALLDRIESWGSKSTDWTAAKVADLAAEYGARQIVVDDIGVGGGVTDQLRKMQDNDDHGNPGKLEEVVVKGLNVAQKSLVTRKGVALYVNLKAEHNFGMRKRFEKGLILVNSELRGHQVVNESCDVRYGFGASGRSFKIETKDDYRKRHDGKSPDFWDAVVLAFAAKTIDYAGYGWL